MRIVNFLIIGLVAGAFTALTNAPAAAQHAGNKHMEMTPARSGTRADTVRAEHLVTELRAAIAKYADTSAAVKDGYRMFLPRVKEQRVYHFTNNARALKEAFRFNPAQPTSLLYRRDSTGKFRLLGAMYTMPKRASLSRLDARVPLSIAHWHKHVNWCLPRKGQESRFLETRGGEPLFGPESPIATKAECDAVGGNFRSNVFGWMVHVNVNAGDDLAAIFGDDHASGHMMHPEP